MPDPILLTPGPLTTSIATKRAMLHDLGSRERPFIELTASVRRDLLAVVGGGDDHTCVPMQGSGTFAVEAAIGTLIPRDATVLVPVNGAYGRRIVEICRRLGRRAIALDQPETAALDVDAIERALGPGVGHLAVVHVETGAGLENPLAAIAALCRRRGVRLIVDAMSSFAALPLELGALGCDAIVAASGKCLEGVPGVGFVIARRDALARGRGASHSLALDLADQHDELERSGQWRFTPPTQVVAALRVALDRLAAEGGPAARLVRYREHCRIVRAGMAALGLALPVAEHLQAPIIVSVRAPADPGWQFAAFHDRVLARGFAVYPGKLAGLDTFRVGCVGAIGADDVRAAVRAIGDALAPA